MLDTMLMPLRRYADFKGRSRRKEYWLFTLFVLIVTIVLVGIAFASGFSYRAMVQGGSAGAGLGVITIIALSLLGLFYLAIFIPGIAVAVRRFHDRDMSGWWYLGLIVLGMVPLIGSLAGIAQIVIFCLPGTPGTNRFGADPKDPSGAEIFA
ncbi:DUF805 domain-containing protein [Novosphingobium gossypii]|uniref:DUF805 domain-containing protein n=1 Tax=Novosphingobium gossypii TaxID=1604774 RepID=UPI003D194CFD